MIEQHELNDIWSLYFHDPNDSNWTYDGYTKLCDITTAEEFAEVNFMLKSSIAKGSFFIMREYVFPCWDDVNNIKGGCLSLKIGQDHAYDVWSAIASKMLGEKLLKDTSDWNNVNGLSISPKKWYCIIKIWMKDVHLNDKKYFDLPNTNSEILFKTNQSSIDACHTR